MKRPTDPDEALAELFPLAAGDPNGFRDLIPSLLRMLAAALDEASRGSQDPLVAAIRAAAAKQGGAGPFAQRVIDGDQALLQVVWDMAVEALVMDALADLWGTGEANDKGANRGGER